MEVVDITLFNNELELLDLRVRILEDVVDRFVVKEATETFQGKEKEMLARLYEHPKVTVYEFDFPEELRDPGVEVDLSQGNNNWARDKYQRGVRVPLDGVSDGAIVLTSDLDEIPNPDAINWLKDNFNPEAVYAFDLLNFQYYLNVRNVSEPIVGTRACSIEMYRQVDAQTLREMYTVYGNSLLVQEAGWHFTFLGGADQIRNKIGSYAHTEHKNPHILDGIEYRMDNNIDVFNRDFKLVTVDVDDSYPDYIYRNQDKLAHLIKK